MNVKSKPTAPAAGARKPAAGTQAGGKAASAKASAKAAAPALIAENRKASYNYFIDERFEAGVVLAGWEVKAIRAGRCQLGEGYVVVRDGELFLIGAHIGALESASTHVKPDPTRTRKLLMHRDEIRRLIGKVEQRGFTLVPLNLHFRNGRVKADIALARGKKLHDKRDTEAERDWQREKARLMRNKG